VVLQRLIQSAKWIPGFSWFYYSSTGHHLVEGLRWHLLRSRKEKQSWQARSSRLVECPDNAKIPRIADAGKLVGGALIMHNGIRVRPDSYYNYAAMKMMQRNHGVHEPQEELAFQSVLPFIGRESCMLELGAYWSFYSIWFSKEVPGARNILVEPAASNLQIGRENCRINSIDATFVQAMVSGTSRSSRDPSERVVTVDEVFAECGVKRLAMLHADIQGFEGEMLDGCTGVFQRRAVDWVFISTHSAELHRECLEKLRMSGFQIVCEHDLAQSFSGDGLIVAKLPEVEGPSRIEVSKRSV
jgi:FkbM family methyltransferase